MDTQAGKQFSHKNGKVQTSGKGTHVGGRDSIRERGNCSEHMNVEAWGQISPTFKNPRDQQDKAPTELGPANCTPITSLFPLPDSPMAHLQLGPITDCKVYSRKRWCKKKASQGHRGPDTAKDSDVATKHQQLQKTADEKVYDGDQATFTHEDTTTQPTHEDVTSAPTQFQEAENLWKVATDLGVTCGPEQRNYVQKLIEMEDRDLKEAERLGNRRRTP